MIRRSLYAAFGGFPLDDVFRRHGGEDGAFSLALLNIFGNPRLDDCKRVRMHYHPNIHAERYFRISMGMLAAPDELVDATHEAITELRDAELAPHLTAQAAQTAQAAPNQSA